jgi:GcrA cell cycle regulator
MSVSWTEERIATLKQMWEAGQTASQIAEALGGVSRNAVIGKAHRLELQARPSPVKSSEPVAEEVAPVVEEPAPFAEEPLVEAAEPEPEPELEQEAEVEPVAADAPPGPRQAVA